MTDTSGLPSAIGIDAVECVAEPAAGVTVHVSGRWGRRRPEWDGPAMLVIDADGERHGVPGTPEPQLPNGTPPGTWTMRFVVAAELARHLAGPVWLALGSVMVPLALPRAGEMGGGRVPADVEVLPVRESRGYVVAAQSAWRRAREADARATGLQREIERLQAELATMHHEPERLRALIAERERAILLSGQALHAEEARRSELQAVVIEQQREAERLRRRARALAGRVDELKRELRRARRAVDEARHEAAAARAAAARAERQASARADPARDAPGAMGRNAGLAIETALSQVARRKAVVVLALPSARPLLPRLALGLERSLVARVVTTGLLGGRIQATNTALRTELATARRALVQERDDRRGDQARIAELERDLARQRERDLERERDLARQRERGFERERDLARQRERTTGAPTAIADVRGEFGASGAATPTLRPGDASVSGPALAPDLSILQLVPDRGGATFEPDRLSAALDRLRAQHPEGEAAPHAPAPEAADGQAAAPAPTDAQPPATAPAHAQTSTPAPTTPRSDPSRPAPASAAHVPATGAPSAAPLHSPSGPPPDAVPRLFRALAREDPAAAGRLVLALLPAQRLVYPRPVAYDLVVGVDACVRVTVGTGAPEVELAAAPRASHEVQFCVDGDPASLARLLSAGPARRLVRRGLARRRGERPAFSALQLLPATPLWPHHLHAAGVRLDAALTLGLAALMIDGLDTEGFSIAHRAVGSSPPDATLHVARGGRATVSALALELPATTTIICPPGELLGVLLGRRGADVTIIGDERPVALLRRALVRA